MERELHAAQKRLDFVNAEISLIATAIRCGFADAVDVSQIGSLQLEAANLTALVCELEGRFADCEGA